MLQKKNFFFDELKPLEQANQGFRVTDFVSHGRVLSALAAALLSAVP